MSSALSILFTVYALLTGKPVIGCKLVDMVDSHINLRDFSEDNYAALEASLESRTCITGSISVDSMGIYYALQPQEEEDGTINLGFSRITTDLNRASFAQNNQKHGETYTICGLLKDATPFRGCAENYCKWYRLTGAQPSGIGRGNPRQKNLAQ